MLVKNKSQNCLNAGLKALSAHEYRAVHTLAMARLSEDIQDPTPFYLLAHIAADHGNTAKAEELFEKAANLAPEDSRFVSGFAKILSLRGKQNEARLQNERAAKLPLHNAHVADTIGVVFSRTGFHEKAVPFFEKAISLNPKHDNFHFNLAASLQFLGKFKAAAASYREAISRNPENVRAYSSLVNLEKQSSETNELKTLYQLYEINKNDEEKALHIGHSIAKTLEDLGQYEDSLEWLEKGKALKYEGLNDNVNKYINIFQASQSSFKNILPPKNPSLEAPIFIIGLPRTGTTLVDRILSSHPDVISCGELNAFAGLIKAGAQTQSNIVMDSETFKRSAKIDLAKIGKDYWEQTQALRQNMLRMTDKMPLNFFYAGLIHRAFPNARIVCLRRGAMDSCLSNYRQLFSTSYSYYDYTLSLKDTAYYYRHFDALMSHWDSILPSNRFMQIQYEDIVFNQESQTRRLLEFCGLSWDETCLDFHHNKAAVSTASSVQVRQPLYSSSIGRWRKYGTKLDSLRSDLGDLAE